MHNFKKVLKTVLVFGIMVAILSLAVLALVFNGENGYYQDGNVRDAYAGTIDFFIVGASRAERSIKPVGLDDQLGVHAYSLVGPHLTMKGRYMLLEKEMKRNPVKTVLMEMSDESLTVSRKTDGLEGDLYYVMKMNTLKEQVTGFLSLIYPRHYPDAYVFLMKHGMSFINKLVTGEYVTFNQNSYDRKGYVPYTGKERKPMDLTAEGEQAYLDSYNTVTLETEMNDENLYYLDKIVSLCKEYDARLILLTTTVSRMETCMVTNEQFFYDWYSQYAKDHEIEYYDMNLRRNRDKAFSDEYCFNDLYHISNKGAKPFTKELIRMMKKIDQGVPHEKLFFDSYAEYEATQSYSK
ncbi:MAG: hypothetical protein MJ097_00725 [Dorea sp.]|nr:hypothetical protein [Dorea sp.]